MTNAVKTIVDYLMTEFNLKKMIIATSTDNFKSQRIAHKCGFKYINMEEKSFNINGQLIDINIYELENKNYQKWIWINL